MGISSFFGGFHFRLGADHVKNSPQKLWMLVNFLTRPWIKSNKKPAISNGFCTSLNFLKLGSGGGGGN